MVVWEIMRIFARFVPSCAYANGGGREEAVKGELTDNLLKAKMLIKPIY